MSISTKDILLQMEGVRYKRRDGTLYVKKKKIAWKAEHKNHVSVSHRFHKIKSK